MLVSFRMINSIVAYHFLICMILLLIGWHRCSQCDFFYCIGPLWSLFAVCYLVV